VVLLTYRQTQSLRLIGRRSSHHGTAGQHPNALPCHCTNRAAQRGPTGWTVARKPIPSGTPLPYTCGRPQRFRPGARWGRSATATTTALPTPASAAESGCRSMSPADLNPAVSDIAASACAREHRVESGELDSASCDRCLERTLRRLAGVVETGGRRGSAGVDSSDQRRSGWSCTRVR
jgi:hypothetical protein